MNHEQSNYTGLPLHVVLRRRRQQLHLMQTDIADDLQISPECVGMYENGRRRMSLDKLPRLAHILQLDQRQFCLQALEEFHPAFYAAVFATNGEEAAAATLA